MSNQPLQRRDFGKSWTGAHLVSLLALRTSILVSSSLMYCCLRSRNSLCGERNRDETQRFSTFTDEREVGRQERGRQGRTDLGDSILSLPALCSLLLAPILRSTLPFPSCNRRGFRRVLGVIIVLWEVSGGKRRGRANVSKTDDGHG